MAENDDIRAEIRGLRPFLSASASASISAGEKAVAVGDKVHEALARTDIRMERIEDIVKPLVDAEIERRAAGSRIERILRPTSIVQALSTMIIVLSLVGAFGFGILAVVDRAAFVQVFLALIDALPGADVDQCPAISSESL